MKRLLLLLALFTSQRPAYAVHPDALDDFVYRNKYTELNFVIKYLGDNTWTERYLEYQDRPRLRWQVRCDRSQIRYAWNGKPYEYEERGKWPKSIEEEKWEKVRIMPNSFQTNIHVVRYFYYSCRGPKVFLRYWPPAEPFTLNKQQP